VSTRQIGGGIYADDTMSDGEVRSERAARYLYMTDATFSRLMADGTLGDVSDALEERPDGTYAVPNRLVERELVREVELALSFSQTGVSEVCVLPACGQDATSSARGFSLCDTHAHALQGWDDLVG
jgi:hypothetical protein